MICRRVGGRRGGVQIGKGREGVGEEGAGTVGERRDDLTETWCGGRWPRGVADVRPELILTRERVELGGSARGGSESRTVKSGEDVRLNDVWMDGRECGSVVFFDGRDCYSGVW